MADPKKLAPDPGKPATRKVRAFIVDAHGVAFRYREVLVPEDAIEVVEESAVDAFYTVEAKLAQRLHSLKNEMR